MPGENEIDSDAGKQIHRLAGVGHHLLMSKPGRRGDVVVFHHDFEQLRRHRESGSVQNWNDRRTELYRVVYKEDGQSFEV